MPPIDGLVMAGGRSARMGSDKAALHWHGQPQARHLVGLLETLCRHTRVSIRAEQAAEETYRGLDCIPDLHDDIGPISGLCSALRHDPRAAWLLVACDMPLLDKPVLETLIARRDPEAFATTFRAADGKPDPLCAIYEPRCLQVVEERIREGHHSLREMLAGCAVTLLDPPGPGALSQANTPGERDELRRVTQ